MIAVAVGVVVALLLLPLVWRTILLLSKLSLLGLATVAIVAVASEPRSDKAHERISVAAEKGLLELGQGYAAVAGFVSQYEITFDIRRKPQAELPRSTQSSGPEAAARRADTSRHPADRRAAIKLPDET